MKVMDLTLGSLPTEENRIIKATEETEAATIENNEVCRICYEQMSEATDYCHCRGSMGYMHKSCLIEWILYQGEQSNPKCEICHCEYNLTKWKRQYCTMRWVLDWKFWFLTMITGLLTTILVLFFILLATESYGVIGYLSLTLCLTATGGICVIASKKWLFRCIKTQISYEIEKMQAAEQTVVEAEVEIENELVAEEEMV